MCRVLSKVCFVNKAAGHIKHSSHLNNTQYYYALRKYKAGSHYDMLIYINTAVFQLNSLSILVIKCSHKQPHLGCFSYKCIIQHFIVFKYRK